jgi:2-methylisocitrate lyase-like PEP mutase family enzyme
MGSSARRLREMLASGRMVTAPFVFDALQAKLAESVGFEAVYMTGFGTAAARGLPDLGVLSMNEMSANARSIAGAVAVPAICDADTGYGNALNVQRTVREFEDAGAAAIHLEDQVWPKRCGFLEGKQVIPAEQMIPKLRAACDARRDPDFVIIARTDALQPHGWDEAERRARAYAEAGADLVFVDGIASTQELEEYARRLADLPRLYNGSAPVREVADLGFRLMIHIGTLGVAYRALRDAFAELMATGQIKSASDPAAFTELLSLLGVEDALRKARDYES